MSLIGAGVLLYLTVGSVRGFAFFLGLSTLLDLVVAYFFMRPAVHPRVSQARLATGASARSSASTPARPSWPGSPA